MRSRKRGKGERRGKEKGGRRRMEEGNIIYSNTYL